MLRNVRGFTLLETILVMVVISILAAVAVPRLPRAETVNVESQAERFASDLRRARMLAMTQFRSLCVRTDNSRYYVSASSGGGACTSTTPVAEALQGNFEVALGSGMSVACSSGCENFRFRSNGTAWAGSNTTAPVGSAVFVLTGGTRSVTVSVAGATGTVTVS